MITQHGNQPIHLNQLLVLEEFLVFFGAVLLQFNRQLSKCSGDGGNITCPIRLSYGTIWLLPFVSVNTSFGYRNNSESTCCSAMGNDWLHWIHSISNQLHIVTLLLWHVEPLCAWVCARPSSHGTSLSASSGRKTEKGLLLHQRS